MIVDFGETFFSDTYEVRDAAGVLANAGTVTATVTLPDATTTAPSVANPSAGKYTFDYLTTQAGRHSVLVSATGGVLGSGVLRWTDVFDVRQVEPALVSLADVKAHINQPPTTTTANEELRRMIASATAVVEYFCGPCVRRTYTDEVQGGSSAIILHRDQVISLTSVTPILTSAPVVTVADLDVSPSGILRHKSEQSISWGMLRVVYVAGRAIVPDELAEAALIITKHLWETQRGPGSASVLGTVSTQSGETTFLPVMGFAIPNRAMDLMKVHPAPAGVA